MNIQKHCPHAINTSTVSCINFKGTINIRNLKLSSITGTKDACPFTHTNIKQRYFINVHYITEMEMNLQIDFISLIEWRAIVKTIAPLFTYLSTDVPRTLISSFLCNGQKDRQMGRIVSCDSIDTKNNDFMKTQKQCTDRNRNLPIYKNAY